ALYPLISATTTLWGAPADSSHDTQRWTPQEAQCLCVPNIPPRPAGVANLAFMTNPTRCDTPEQVGFAADSYQDPGDFSVAAAASPAFPGCASLPFNPEISLKPTTNHAASSSGMDVNLTLPQDKITDPNGLAEAHLKNAVVTLPQGMTLNPSSADGL